MTGIFETLKEWAAGLNGSGGQKDREMKDLEDAILDFADKYGQAGKWHGLTTTPVSGPIDGKVREVTTAVIGRLPSDSRLTAFVGTDSLKSMITANRSLYSNLEKDHWDMFRVDSLNPSDKKTILGLIAESLATDRFVREDPDKRESAYEAIVKSAKFGSPMDASSYKALHDYLASYGEIGMARVTADRLWNTSYLDFKDEKYADAARKELDGVVSDIQEELEDLRNDRHLITQERNFAEAREHLMSVLDSARSDLGDTILIKPTPVKLAGSAFAKATGVYLAPDGNGGGEYRLLGSYSDALAVEMNGHTEFNVCKILDAVASINGLAKAVHEAHVNHLEQVAKQAIHDRIVTPSARRFTPEQVEVLNRYHQVAVPDKPAGEVFKELLQEVSQEPDVARKPEKWVADTAKELDDLAGGITRDHCQGLIR